MRIAVVIPAGPRDDVLDTLDSVVHYTDPSRVVVVVDDTGNPATAARIRSLQAQITVIPPPPRAPGVLGGLWVKLAAGYRWVLSRYEPGLILRLDADALLIGRGLEGRAEAVFARDPGVGLLGSYRVGPDGGLRDFRRTARDVRAATGIRGLAHPRCRAALRARLGQARSHGYEDGENALGGAYIHSGAAAHSMYRRGFFSQPWLAASRLGEDSIMALLTVSAGFRLGDFGGPEGPMALRWKGLPAPPERLLAEGKLLTHSVRSWEDLTEQQIRGFFARVRTADLVP